ncbi:MAG: type II toxin-antitoxin system RelE/ParE family toxin [Burkholderiales bacterium]
MLSRLRSLFASSEPPKEQDVPLATRQAETIHTALLFAVGNGVLSESEIAAAVLAESAAIHGTLVSFEQPEEIENAFKRLIAEGIGFRTYAEQHAQVAAKYSRISSFDRGGLFSIELAWGFALGPDFIKSIERIGDKKLQGRVLEAILKIARSPTTVVGDTVKPLTADLKGLWRYRVGSYRLVYAPDSTERRVTLLSFEARSDVYS